MAKIFLDVSEEQKGVIYTYSDVYNFSMNPVKKNKVDSKITYEKYVSEVGKKPQILSSVNFLRHYTWVILSLANGTKWYKPFGPAIFA